MVSARTTRINTSLTNLEDKFTRVEVRDETQKNMFGQAVGFTRKGRIY